LRVLHLHQVAQGTFTPKLSDMSDTQDAARRLRRCRRRRGGILDCRCARCSARWQVGTKGWSLSDRTKGCPLELNSTHSLTMPNLLNLTHTTGCCGFASACPKPCSVATSGIMTMFSRAVSTTGSASVAGADGSAGKTARGDQDRF
jgi:hypothetical protein